MDKKFELVLSKIDKLDERLDAIDKTLIKQEGNLEKHMLRTDQNEEMIQVIVHDLKPVKHHVYYMHGALKALGVLSLLLGIAALVKQLLFT